jgi:hypothetical protein
VTGTKLIEIDFDAAGSTDSGVVFDTLLESGLIHWAKNHNSWARISKMVVELADPAGTINFSAWGTRRGRDFTSVGSRQIQAQYGESGFGADLLGDIVFGDSGSTGATYSQPSTKKTLKINKVLNNLRWSLSSSTADARYSVIQIVIEGTLLPTSDPSDWKS